MFARVAISLGLLFFAACSQQGSQVKLEVKSAFAFGGAQLSAYSGGGLMVWGKSSSGQEFGRSLEGSDEINLTLPNGTWTFYAMAWDGSSNWVPAGDVNFPLGGKIRCAKSTPASLSGGALAVSLTLDNASCSGGDFAGGIAPTGGAGNLALARTKLRFCENLSNVATATDACDDDFGATNHKSARGAVGSYRFILRAFDGQNGQHQFLAGGITSACVTFFGDSSPTSGVTSAVARNLPAGNPQAPFHVTLEVFTTADCDAGVDARGAIQLQFPTGVGQAMPGGKYHSVASTPSDIRLHSIALPDSQVCAGRDNVGANTPFAGGDGTLDRPFLLCSVRQLRQINGNPVANVFQKHFRLLRDLDFNPFSKGASATAFDAPNDPSCLELGTNFLPLGYENQSCNGPGDPSFGSPTTFTGRFFGRGHALQNLRFHSETLAGVGLFAAIGTDAAGVHDLKIVNPDIEGACEVGALVGRADGSSANGLKLQRVRLNGGRVEGLHDVCSGNSTTGGLVGLLSNAKLEHSFVRKTRVRGLLSEVGGAVGSASDSTLERLSVEADVSAHGPGGKVGIGGVVGYANNTVLNYVKHEGLVHTIGSKVGGIVGHAIGSSTLNNFYAISAVINDDISSSIATGGTIGHWAGGNYGYGFTLSHVQTGCTSSCQHGYVVGVLTGSPTISQNYTVPSEGILTSPVSHNQSILSNLSNANPTNLSFTAAAGGGTDDWAVLAGEIPRFDFEEHPCQSPGFSGSGDGSLAAPVRICRLDQLMAINGSGLRHTLEANIRLPNATPPVHMINSYNGHLDGKEHALLGGNTSTASSAVTGFMGTLGGTLKNLRVHGLSASRTATSGSAAGVLVAQVTSSGRLENVSLNAAFGNFLNNGAGVVGVNAGTLSGVSFTGKIQGGSYLAGLVRQNDEMVEGSTFDGELLCSESPGCVVHAGLAVDNGGTIQNSVMSGRKNDGSYDTDSAVMLVDNNGGTLRDIHVPAKARFVVGGLYPRLFTSSNGGNALRLYNEGELVFKNTTAASAFPTGWNSVHDLGGAGSASDVQRAGRSGKLLLDRTSYTCNSGVYSVAGWGVMSIATSSGWGTYLSTTLPYNPLTDGSKKLVVRAESDAGTETYQVNQTTPVVNDLDLTPFGTGCTSDGVLSLYWTEDIPVTPGSSTAAAGAMLPQDLASSRKALLGAAWGNVTADITTASDEEWLVSYFLALAGTGTMPATTPVWMLDENGEIELIEKP